MDKFTYTLDNKRYHTYNYNLKTKFNTKVSKISLDAGFTCPNRDGSKGNNGCLYCSLKGSGDYAGDRHLDLNKQFYDIKQVMDRKWPNSKYIAYFQAFSNTYAPLETLKLKYESVLNIHDVVGINIATRCDCISDETITYLKELSNTTYLTVELGLQTIHPKTMTYLNLGYDLQTFEDTLLKLRNNNINVVVHIINGLPCEDKSMMLETVEYLNKLDIQGIKIHMLHIIKNTPLGELYQKEPWAMLTKEEYIDIVCEQLSYLDEKIVIHRLTGDAKLEDLIAPLWIVKKVSVTNDIDKEMAKRNYYQGCKKEA